MQDISEYITKLKEKEEIKDLIEPLIQHITKLEAELRNIRLRVDEHNLNQLKSSIKSSSSKKELSLGERNLYRAVGELAFVIAKADNIMREEERRAFHKVIVEDFGENSWIALDRFQFIENIPTSDVESTYNHVIFLIKQNKQALTEDLVIKFIHVIEKVAEVAGIHENQYKYIDRFKADLQKINL